MKNKIYIKTEGKNYEYDDVFWVQIEKSGCAVLDEVTTYLCTC